MSLQISALSASNVPNPESIGKCDPYAVVEYLGFKKTTEVRKGDLNPKWDEVFEFPLGANGVAVQDNLIITIFDWERIGRNRLLGSVTIPLKKFVQKGGMSEEVMGLVAGNGREIAGASLKVTISVVLAGGAADGKTDATGATVVTAGGAGDDDDEELEQEDEVDAGRSAKLGAGPLRKKKKGHRVKRLRQGLPTKPIDIQIRLKVVEARQLNGANLQPVVRVSVKGETKQTRIKKSMASPWWDESFFFNFRIAPAELVDEVVDFSVFNSRTLRSDALIGGFKCDVGLIYDEPQHAIINKWVLLSDPEDQQAGPKGYLKISAVVMGPGDVSPNLAAKPFDDDEDIESNLLRPAGVQLRPATFTLRVYYAEDIPRMDSAFLEGVKKIFGIGDEPKDLVDPYFVFSFAGKETQSKIIYADDHPHWYQDLKLGVQFPSMCERIKFQIKDWDRLNEDDTVGTVFINMSEVSSSGERGFLPTFGPTYVNFYGSTREYTDLPDDYDDLNLGKYEGVAYRGRALVELVTTMGELPEKSVEDMAGDDRLVVEKYMRRRSYRVHATFLTASMISSSHVDGPIEFEVSMGNYGNKMDENVNPMPSTTQPTNAVFDGCYYYFLPWGATKPTVCIEASWEDISFRLESLNVLQRIAETLESNIERVKVGVKARLPTPEVAQLLISMLDQLIEDCSTRLSRPKEGRHVPNKLDKQLLAHRETAMKSVKEMALSLRETATDVLEALYEAENMLGIIKSEVHEPQNSMPDVIIWMLSGSNRIAYARIPANEVLFSEKETLRGKNCTQIISVPMKYPQKKDEKRAEIPAVLRVRIWLGLAHEDKYWNKIISPGKLSVFAETYENQVNVLGTWTNKGPTMTRPKYSDCDGKRELKKEDFVSPEGWKWDGSWFISPELSLLFDKDAGHHTFLEDVYECQARKMPAGKWEPATRAWTDVKGDPCPAKHKVKLPSGWKWNDNWRVDINRAVDEEGWEYCVEATMGGYGAVQKTYHLCRRRRWVRPRTHTVRDKQVKTEALKKKHLQGWEYAPVFTMKFHSQERTVDLVRRRRWHRKLTATTKNAACFFSIVPQGKDAASSILAAPRMYVSYAQPNTYQLRAYLYQARDLLPGDETGLSDPFARVAFLTNSAVTETVKQTLCPTWDQTLIIAEAQLRGQEDSLETSPPPVYVEIFDYDTFGKPEYLGRTKALPMVKTNPRDSRTPVLQWYKIKKLGRDAGELLAAFELIKLSEGEAGVDTEAELQDIVIDPDAPEVKEEEEPEEEEEQVADDSEEKPEDTSASIEARIEPVDPSAVDDKPLQEGRQVQEQADTNVLEQQVGFGMPFLPPKRGDLYIVPNGIRPVMQRTAVEILCWGVRNMKRFQLSAVSSPSVTFECGGHQLESCVIKDTKKNPNFMNNLLFFDVMLPREELYMPPMNIKVKDHRQFGRKPAVGLHIVKSLEDFRTQPLDMTAFKLPITMPDNIVLGGDTTIDMPGDESGTRTLRILTKKSTPLNRPAFEELDWWSKYYASTNDNEKCKKYRALGYDNLMVMPSELEKFETYEGFEDFLHTFKLVRGMNDDDEDDNVVGEFKGSFRLYPLPPDPSETLPPRIFHSLPPSTPEECIVRVYIIEAVDLQPADPNGLADPYVEVQIGKKMENSRDDYIPNSISPIFGRLFEMKAIIPLEKDLIVRVKDYDLLTSDDLIGETVIDLENRYLTKYRATVGLPKSYWVTGINQWRDSKKPTEILANYCVSNMIPEPLFQNKRTVIVSGQTFTLEDFESSGVRNAHLGPEEERLALHILNCLPLVKEHVESRPLYNPLQPHIEQGRLHMFVDIFPQSLGPPGPSFDIRPRKPKKFVLRVVIWNTKDVPLEEEAITGEKMSDIYVSGWLAGIDEKQKTDVHYRSLDGEGNFNWRFVFPFEYMVAEQVMIIKKKDHFWSLDETELKTQPKFAVQIWDNDKFSQDDFIGHLELNLNYMPAPARKRRQCTLEQLPEVNKNAKMVSLFEARRLKGFWPAYDESSGEKQIAGKIEMELELVTAEEALERPAGPGRDDPNMNPKLEPPNRPATSFLWFTSPWKSCRYVIWHNYKWRILLVLLFFLLVLLLLLFIYAFPGNFSRWLIGSR